MRARCTVLAACAIVLSGCAADRRLLEIGRRNEIRREAGLPFLSITKIAAAETAGGVVGVPPLEAAHGPGVWAQVLETRRQAKVIQTGSRIGQRASVAKKKSALFSGHNRRRSLAIPASNLGPQTLAITVAAQARASNSL